MGTPLITYQSLSGVRLSFFEVEKMDLRGNKNLISQENANNRHIFVDIWKDVRYRY